MNSLDEAMRRVGFLVTCTFIAVVLLYILYSLIVTSQELFSRDLSYCQHTISAEEVANSHTYYLCVKPDHPQYEELRQEALR